MLKAVIENTSIICPICNRMEKKIFRRDMSETGNVRILCRCMHCDQIFSYEVNKAGKNLTG
jgi:hypothetical protein